MVTEHVDVAIIGGGPAGQLAATTATAAGQRTVLIEQEPHVGGECVRRGTIPSKTLRETALAVSAFRAKSGGVVEVSLGTDVQLESLMRRKTEVIDAHHAFIADELRICGVEVWHGRARFLSPHELEVVSVAGGKRVLHAKVVLIATGSRPRTPPDVPIDHEHLLDSDSILSMAWLPRSLTVLGSGVIASEYASIFAALGVTVTMIDRAARPVAFLDEELTSAFSAAFSATGSRFVGGRKTLEVSWNGVDAVETRLDDGEVVRSEKLLCALGRVANVEALRLEAAGLSTNARGLIAVDANLRTPVEHIYAVGDVIGPPSLASTSMEQGRRAIRHWLGLPIGPGPELIPAGVYTIPEMSSVGLTEAQAREQHGTVVLGRARFDRLARGQISGAPNGLLKLVCDASGKLLLGVHVVGEGAAELVHLGQLALSARLPIDTFVDDIFNFPTMAEAYRVAALDIVRQRTRRETERASAA
ncbi:MAG: Si-specific NAD(P)(+) transhydrogenase [Myxococcales bacterium]|nr:Si-specific NAD(P)(+) transhydrogenase [Myxococcales bacterium]